MKTATKREGEAELHAFAVSNLSYRASLSLLVCLCLFFLILHPASSLNLNKCFLSPYLPAVSFKQMQLPPKP